MQIDTFTNTKVAILNSKYQLRNAKCGVQRANGNGCMVKCYVQRATYNVQEVQKDTKCKVHSPKHKGQRPRYQGIRL